MAKIRLDKYLADMQIGTRSAVKEYIRKGRVRVNEAVVKSPEQKIDTETDTVLYDDKPVGYHTYEYFMLNKPQGVVSATQDTKEKTVTELIIEKNRKDLFPVGRLDKDTEGLLLITNDGALSHELLSPKKTTSIKRILRKLWGKIGQAEVIKFKEGLVIDTEFTALPAVLEVLSFDEAKNTSRIRVTIHEGKFHQVKRMFEAVGSEVLYLKRLSMGTLVLDESLAPGAYRRLTEQEIQCKGTRNIRKMVKIFCRFQRKI